ncbi:MAG TPA: hypothetical protein PK440_16920 [Candidatus Accumulibacter phosphatis]|nr:MAG: hypothetical protein AW07_03924 [Candidatus Accumulibacter sp. SK-11]HAY27258.1 hypothetical protein [Accumulibacter sp.]HRL77670.1 hypothetical protein [Candidatus Accumulibacter phosphatis]HCN68182.1 hypothetical protein [Accumulibacter sp.]HCV13081.1 hypothetical protein [Accumulibacter sp.]
MNVTDHHPPSALEPDEGSRFTTLRLVHEGSTWVFRATGLTQLLIRIISLLGYAGIVGGALHLWQGPLLGMVFVGICALFVWVGRYLASLLGTGARFDTLKRRVEVLHRRGLKPSFGLAVETTTLDFDEVRQLEIVYKRVKDTENDDYDNYELNLVMQDGQRFNLASHPDDGQIAREAVQLATLLGRPLADWRLSSDARESR